MIRIALLEDEQEQRDLLSGYLKRLFAGRGLPFQTALFSTGEDFLKAPEGFDILLADICLEGGAVSGMEAARAYRAKCPEGVIIFITNLVQYALEGYSVDALNFIVKPVDYSLFSQKLGRALEILSRREERICFSTKRGMECLRSEDLFYIETAGRGLLIHARGRDIPCTETMAAMEGMLRQAPFFRCHKAFLVNLDHVQSVDGGDVVVAGARIPLSRHRKKDMLDALVKRLGGRIS